MQYISYIQHMHTGVIKSVDFNKGLGYVQEDSGKEVLLVALGLEQKINQGTTVHFNIRQTRLGIIAVNIEPITPPGGTALAV